MTSAAHDGRASGRRAQQRVDELRRERADSARRESGSLPEHALVVEVGRVLARPRSPARHDLVDEEADRIEVLAHVERRPRHELGRAVLRRADEQLLGRLFESDGDAEVDEVGRVLLVAIERDEHVGGLQVAVQEAGPVQVVQAAQDLEDPRIGRARLTHLHERVGHRDPAHIVHREVGDLAPGVLTEAEVIDRRDRGVIETPLDRVLAHEVGGRLAVRATAASRRPGARPRGCRGRASPDPSHLRPAFALPDTGRPRPANCSPP